jgi:branched-chain amino acid aminotransferase
MRTETHRSSSLTSPIIWINGQSMAADVAHLSALDRGFTLADGVFETMRIEDGVVFRLDHHLHRLSGATAALGIGLRTDVGRTVAAAVAAARTAGVQQAGVRITVSRGTSLPGVAPSPDSEPTVVVAVFALPVFPPGVYANGLSARIATGRRNEYAMTAGLKTIAYTDSVAALVEARAAGADDAIFLDTEGHVSEGTSSNVFVGNGGALGTPPLSCGALPGITRAAVLELAAGLGITVDERPIPGDALFGADEIFLTSSLRAIAPVTSVNSDAIGPSTPGPLTRRLMAEYASLVRRETRT